MKRFYRAAEEYSRQIENFICLKECNSFMNSKHMAVFMFALEWTLKNPNKLLQRSKIEDELDKLGYRNLKGDTRITSYAVMILCNELTEVKLFKKDNRNYTLASNYQDILMATDSTISSHNILNKKVIITFGDLSKKANELIAKIKSESLKIVTSEEATTLTETKANTSEPNAKKPCNIGKQDREKKESSTYSAILNGLPEPVRLNSPEVPHEPSTDGAKFTEIFSALGPLLTPKDYQAISIDTQIDSTKLMLG